MPTKQKTRSPSARIIHAGRFVMAVFLLLLAAVHLSMATPSSSGGGGSYHVPSNTPANTITSGFSGSSGSSFNAIGLWEDIEIITYTIIAVVYLLGARTWYALSMLFIIFNVAIYFISGVAAIPGITSNAFGSRLNFFSFNSELMVLCWIGAVILGLVLFKYDPGSELDKLLVTKKA